MKLYFVSVNDLLAAAINGKPSGLMPGPGEVDSFLVGSSGVGRYLRQLYNFKFVTLAMALHLAPEP